MKRTIFDESEMDEFLDLFIDEMGEPTSTAFKTDSFIDQYSNLLPDLLITLWKQYGLASFRDGLLWLTNPGDYQVALTQWLHGAVDFSPCACLVFARTAFGEFFAIDTASGRVVTFSAPSGFIMTKKIKNHSNTDNNTRALQTFLATVQASDFDQEDSDGASLFQKALNTLGPLNEDTVYGFKQPPSKGGSPTLENLTKIPLQAYLDDLLKDQTPFLKLV